MTARLLHETPAQMGLPGKKLQYVEQQFSRLLTRLDALAFMVPEMEPGDATLAKLPAYVDVLDGLVLQGGADISPTHYGQEPLCDAWRGDPQRDVYELALLKEFRRQGKPVLGICRGAQLINVALGGSLHQDLATTSRGADRHRDAALYDGLLHDVAFVPGTRLAALYAPLARARITSIHHQAVDRLAEGLVVEARSEPDGVVEAFRAVAGPYLVGVQWHPEFHDGVALLSSEPLMQEFLNACRENGKGFQQKESSMLPSASI